MALSLFRSAGPGSIRNCLQLHRVVMLRMTEGNKKILENLRFKDFVNKFSHWGEAGT